MAPKLSRADLLNAYKLYCSGKSMEDVSRIIHFNAGWLSALFKQNGFKLRTKSEDCLLMWKTKLTRTCKDLSPREIKEAYELYQKGEALIHLAKKLRVNRGQLSIWFRDAGYELRSWSDGHNLRYLNTTKEERMAITEAARNKRKSQNTSLKEKLGHAKGRHNLIYLMSDLEKEFAKFLDKEKIPFIYNQVCGTYNIDFAISDTVAVEIYGGNWHTMPNHRAGFEKRTRHILNSGWHQVVVWTKTKRPELAWVTAIDEIRSLLDRTSRNPTVIREHRVISCYGELYSVETLDCKKFTMEASYHLRRNLVTGKYESFS